MILKNLIKLPSISISLNSIRNYGQLIWTIFRELFTASTKQVIGIIILSWCSVSALATSFAGFFVLINEWIKQDGLSLGPWNLNFHGDISFTFFAATFLLVLGILGAWCSFFIELLIARTAIQYYKQCCLRLMKQINLPENDGWQGFFGNRLKQGLSRMINDDLQKRGMVAKHMLRIILPGITCFITGCIMIHTDWQLSISVIILSMFFIPYFFRINQSTAVLQRKFEALGKEYRNRFSKSLNNSLQGLQSTSEESLNGFLSSDLFFRHKFMFLKRFAQGDKIQALNSTFFVIIFYVLIVYYILSSGNGIVDWKRLLVFGIAFRFFFNSFRNVAGTISVCSRFYPGVARFEQFGKYCDDLCHKERQIEDILFHQLLNTEITTRDNHDKIKIQTGIIHLMHLAQSQLDINSVKQHIVFLTRYASPAMHPLSGISIIDELPNLNAKPISDAIKMEFGLFLERNLSNYRVTISDFETDTPSVQTILLFHLWRHFKEQRILFILSNILSPAHYRLLKKVAESEKNLLIFIVTSKKELRKLAGIDDTVMVFEDCQPVLTSVNSALLMSKDEPGGDGDDIFEEM